MTAIAVIMDFSGGWYPKFYIFVGSNFGTNNFNERGLLNFQPFPYSLRSLSEIKNKN